MVSIGITRFFLVVLTHGWLVVKLGVPALHNLAFRQCQQAGIIAFPQHVVILGVIIITITRIQVLEVCQLPAALQDALQWDYLIMQLLLKGGDIIHR